MIDLCSENEDCPSPRYTPLPYESGAAPPASHARDSALALRRLPRVLGPQERQMPLEEEEDVDDVTEEEEDDDDAEEEEELPEEKPQALQIDCTFCGRRHAALGGVARLVGAGWTRAQAEEYEHRTDPVLSYEARRAELRARCEALVAATRKRSREELEADPIEQLLADRKRKRQHITF